MRVLVACGFSGVVREAFKRRGHHAVSCDYENTTTPGNHYKGNVLDIIQDDWDLMIAFPPCTYLTVSGNRWMDNPERQQKREEALNFVKLLLDAPIDKIALENPVGVISSRIRKPDQIIHPYQFGEPYEKRTCLWLKNLPKLTATNIVEPKPKIQLPSGKMMSAWYAETANRTKSKRASIRSITFQGIANAMADIWGNQ